MSLPADQVLISADDHLDIHAMPPDTWSSRLPTEWRERGPRVEETSDGPFWFCDGRRVSPSGRKDKGYIAAHDHGFRPGQPRTRLEDTDRDGVRAQVVYGLTCTQRHIVDAALHEQVARVYNDWAAESDAVHDHGISSETLARVAAKALGNGARNPNAFRRKPMPEAAILGSRMLSHPPTQYMLCSPDEGAAAVVLCRADQAHRYTDEPVSLRASTVRTRRLGAFEVHSPWLPVEETAGPTVDASRVSILSV